MKRFLVVLVIVMAFTSCCIPITLDKIPNGEYINYVQTSTSTSTYSPTEYYVVKGVNPSAEYSWREVRVTSYHPEWFRFYCYNGDAGTLIDKAFPDADSILTYGGYFYVGTKNNKVENQ